ncbi:MAG: PhoH family protein [Gammaproteobacteria bacterium]|nr:PhoH family protein [Gammaproteobacteria bacterium]
MTKPRRLFVLDTNVLMHDPTAIFRFQEHAVYLPMAVLEELDAGKKGVSETARNVRQFTRYLDELISHAGGKDIEKGISLDYEGHFRPPQQAKGRLFFQTRNLPDKLPASLPGCKPDNDILNAAIALQEADANVRVTLVSKDINLRIKAQALSIHAEDYSNDKVLDDVDLLYSGERELPADFWKSHEKDSNPWQAQGHTFYTVTGPNVVQWHPNQCLYMEGEEGFEAIVKECRDQQAIIRLPRNFRSSQHSVWGIIARNREQNFALNLLSNPDIDFVTLLGAAGTGKTLLALAAGLAQTLDEQRYREIIVTRVTVPVGEDIGFLPGTEEEKMTPWMGALIDNLEVLNPSNVGGEWGRAVTADLLANRIKIRSLNFMRGRTFLKRYIILEEAQNLTSKQMKTLITRAGPGTKVVCIGNIAQIDTPYLSETTSGLTYVVDRFKNWEHSAHVTLRRGERSRLADFASEVL